MAAAWSVLWIRAVNTPQLKELFPHFFSNLTNTISSRRLTDAWSKDFPEMKNIWSWLRTDWMKYLVNYSLGGLLRKALSWCLLCADKGHILVLYSAHCGCMSSHNFHDQVRHQTQERRLGTSLLYSPLSSRDNAMWHILHERFPGRSCASAACECHNLCSVYNVNDEKLVSHHKSWHVKCV